MSTAKQSGDLIAALETRDITRVAEMLAAEPTLILARVAIEGSHDQSLLHRAIPSDGVTLTPADIALLQSLLDAGVPVDSPGWGSNNGVCTPLTMAAWGGHTPLVRLLLAHGANPDGGPKSVIPPHRRPIDTAAEHGHSATVDALIEGGAAFTLRHLVLAGLYVRAEALLRENPDAATQAFDDGAPPLHLAADMDIARLLLDAGANAQAHDALGRTAIHAALDKDRPAIARFLIENSDAPHDLFAAAGMGGSERVAERLDQNPRLALEAQADGVTALFYAAQVGEVRSVEHLLSAGADISPRAKRFWACLTPLHIALQRNHRAVAAICLERGADPNAFAPDGYWPTPLHVAARWGSRDDVVQLLDHGADPNGGSPLAGSFGPSVLTWAIFAGDETLVRLLLTRGLDPRHPNNREALHLCAERGQLPIARLLLSSGAVTDAKDAQGETPAERAIRFGHPSFCSLLKELSQG